MNKYFALIIVFLIPMYTFGTWDEYNPCQIHYDEGSEYNPFTYFAQQKGGARDSFSTRYLHKDDDTVVFCDDGKIIQLEDVTTSGFSVYSNKNWIFQDEFGTNGEKIWFRGKALDEQAPFIIVNLSGNYLAINNTVYYYTKYYPSSPGAGYWPLKTLKKVEGLLPDKAIGLGDRNVGVSSSRLISDGDVIYAEDKLIVGSNAKKYAYKEGPYLTGVFDEKVIYSDGTNIFQYDKLLEGANVEDYLSGDDFIISRNNVYLFGKKVEGADPETFQHIKNRESNGLNDQNIQIFQDKNYIYITLADFRNHIPLNEFDWESFKNRKECGIYRWNNYIVTIYNSSFYLDADPKSFTCLDEDRAAVDKNNLYIRGEAQKVENTQLAFSIYPLVFIENKIFSSTGLYATFEQNWIPVGNPEFGKNYSMAQNGSTVYIYSGGSLIPQAKNNIPPFLNLYAILSVILLIIGFSIFLRKFYFSITQGKPK